MVDLREVMRRWVTGVTIVTSGEEQNKHGMTVNSFTSLSIEPPLVAVTLAKQTRTQILVEQTGYFGVVLLSEDQSEISDRFSGRISDNGDRFEGLDCYYGIAGVPLLRCGNASLECRVVHRYQMDQSILYVGQVISANKNADTQPLVYFNREYRRLLDEKPKP